MIQAYCTINNNHIIYISLYFRFLHCTRIITTWIEQLRWITVTGKSNKYIKKHCVQIPLLDYRHINGQIAEADLLHLSCLCIKINLDSFTGASKTTTNIDESSSRKYKWWNIVCPCLAWLWVIGQYNSNRRGNHAIVCNHTSIHTTQVGRYRHVIPGLHATRARGRKASWTWSGRQGHYL